MEDKLTIRQAAAHKGVSTMTIKRWQQRGHLIGEKINSTWYFEKEKVDAVPLHVNSGKNRKPKAPQKMGNRNNTPSSTRAVPPPIKKKVTLFSLMEAHTPKEKVDLLFKLLLLLPSIGIAYWIGTQSVGLITGVPSVSAGIIWMFIIAILNLSFFFLKARGFIKAIRVLLILITSLIGVSVIDSIVFAQTIKNLRQENVYSTAVIKTLQGQIEKRRVVLDSSTAVFTREIVGKNGTQTTGYGPIAQRLNNIRISDSLALTVAQNNLKERLEIERLRIENEVQSGDWFTDLSLLYKNTFTDFAKFSVFILIFTAVIILEILPLLFFMDHSKRKAHESD